MSFRYSFRPVLASGGGTINVMAQNPSNSNTIVLGGDVEGFFVTEDKGDHWRITNYGNWQKYLYQCSCVAWSVTEPNTVYAGVGDEGANGGFLASTDGGHTWTLRSTTVQFCGNEVGSPLLAAAAWPRSIGNLIAQDGTNVYVATYKGGVFSSSVSVVGGQNQWGWNWTNIGLSGGNYFCRSMAMDTTSSPGTTILYVATYDWSTSNPGTYGHVWQYNPNNSPAWTQLTNAPPIVEELKIVGGYLYGACGCGGAYTTSTQDPVNAKSNPPNAGNPGGIFRSKLSDLFSNPATTAWASLNDSAGVFMVPASPPDPNNPPYWLSLDGYVNGGNHVIIAGCTNAYLPTLPSGGYTGYRSLVQLTINGSGTVTYGDLCTNASNVDLHIPPEGRLYWRYNQTFKNWMGGKSFTPGYIFMDPVNTNQVFVVGTQGFFRTTSFNPAATDNSGIGWQLAINGMTTYVGHGLVVDPNDPKHVVWCTSDYGLVQITDGIGYDASTTLNNPPKTGLEGWAAAFDPVDSTLFFSIGAKYNNANGDVWHLPSGSSTWTSDALSLAGTSNPLAVDAFNRLLSNGWTYLAAAATTAALPNSPIYNQPGGPGNGVGATLTATINGALTVDGYAVKSGDTLLIQNEAAQANNGLYVVTQKGGLTSKYILTRSPDMNTAAQFPFSPYVEVGNGTSNIGLCFTCTTPGSPSVVFGTTAITWTQTSPLGGPWTVVTGAVGSFSVTNGTGNIQLSSSTIAHTIFLESISSLNNSGQINITWTAQAAGGSHVADLILRSDNTENNCYRIRITQATTGVVTAVIQGIIATTSTNVSGSSFTIPYTAGQTITVQYVIQGSNHTTFFMNVWAGGTVNQPSGWMYNHVDSKDVGPQTAGSIGVNAAAFSGYSANAEFQFSNLNIQTPTVPANGPNGDVAIGLCVGRDNINNRFVLAAVWGSGMWRLYGNVWTQVSTVIAASNSPPTPRAEFDTLISSQQVVYVFDRASGVYVSTDWGQTWTLMWNVTTSGANDYYGFMALNPAVSNELWISNFNNNPSLSGLFKLSVNITTNSGIATYNGYTSTPILSVNNPGAVAVSSGGAVFCITVPTTGSPSQLLRSIDGGNTWENVADDAYQSFLTPLGLKVGGNDRIYLPLTGDTVILGYNTGQSQNT